MKYRGKFPIPKLNLSDQTLTTQEQGASCKNYQNEQQTKLPTNKQPPSIEDYHVLLNNQKLLEILKENSFNWLAFAQ